MRMGERKTLPRKKLNGKKPKVIRYCVEYGIFQDKLFLALLLYLEWTPSSNVLEDVIKVLDNFFLYVFHNQ